MYPQDIQCASQDITHRIYTTFRKINSEEAPQDIKCDVQDITHRTYHPLLRNLLRRGWYILWVISCTSHFISCGQHNFCCSPQDIKCDPQDITHRIYHPLLRNLLRSVGYILWIISCGAHFISCGLLFSTGYKM